MNIQTINKEPFNNIRPTNFLEATIQLAECYKNALAAGTNGDDLGVRYWVDASRTVKAFFKKYQDKEVKEDLVEKLEGNNSKQVLVDSLVVLKCAEPFVNQWVNRFKELSVRNYKKFQDVHWDIFLEHALL